MPFKKLHLFWGYTLLKFLTSPRTLHLWMTIGYNSTARMQGQWTPMRCRRHMGLCPVWFPYTSKSNRTIQVLLSVFSSEMHNIYPCPPPLPFHSITYLNYLSVSAETEPEHWSLIPYWSTRLAMYFFTASTGSYSGDVIDWYKLVDTLVYISVKIILRSSNFSSYFFTCHGRTLDFFIT